MTGAVIAEYLWLDDALVRELSPAGVITYVQAGPLGQPLAAMDGTGAVVWRGELAPFGELVSSTGTPVPKLRFAGQWTEPGLGLHQNWHRTYDATLGRYLQADPLGIAAGQSLYGYVGQDPANAVDPRGLDCVNAHGYVTCFAPVGPVVSFPAPEGWPASISKADDAYHFYNKEVSLSGANLLCVIKGLINNPTPGSPSPASVEGTNNNATPSNIQSAFDLMDRISSFDQDPGRYDNNPVKSYVVNNGTAIVNVTKPGHGFHPGYVVRTIDNGSSVYNYGEGLGILQSKYNPLADQMFNDVWIGLTQELVEKCKCGQ